MTWTFRSGGRRTAPIEVLARRYFRDARRDTYWAQPISRTFWLDGREFPPGSVVVMAASRPHAHGLTAAEFRRWTERTTETAP